MKTNASKKITINYSGDVVDDKLLIGSHGDTELAIDGSFELSGIVYCPKFSLSIRMHGAGRLALRGKCSQIIIKDMDGDCTLDLSQVTYRELQCHSLRGTSRVIAGNTRAITPAILDDDAVLEISSGHLIFNRKTSGNSRICIPDKD